MISHQLPVNNHRQPVILSRRRRIYLNSYPDSSGFLIFYIYNLIFNMMINPLCRCILKMQNKPKFHILQIDIIPFTLRTNKYAPFAPQPKNKPKQTQIDMKCHLEHSEIQRTERRISLSGATSRESIYSNSHLEGVHIFDICALIFNMLFMTNKPNLKTSKKTVSHFLKKTNDYSPAAGDDENKPNTNPIMSS